jgi:hypothetical protein
VVFSRPDLPEHPGRAMSQLRSELLDGCRLSVLTENTCRTRFVRRSSGR